MGRNFSYTVDDWKYVRELLLSNGRSNQIGGHLITSNYLAMRYREIVDWNDNTVDTEEWNPYTDGWPNCTR